MIECVECIFIHEFQLYMPPTAFSAAADRNKAHILTTLQTVLPPQGSALEVASGTGQHVAWFAAGLPGWTWQPTDARPEALASIAAYTGQSPHEETPGRSQVSSSPSGGLTQGGRFGGTHEETPGRSQVSSSPSGGLTQGGRFGGTLANVHPPLLLDVMAPQWLPADQQFDLIYCANMLHIAPWPVCAALMAGSARHLAPGGVLVTYGPYLEDGVPTSPGNLAFDVSLRTDNPAWGIRRREDVEAAAAQAGLHLRQRHAMPANNLLLVWAA